MEKGIKVCDLTDMFKRDLTFLNKELVIKH